MTSPTRLKRILHEVDERAGDRWLDLPLLSVSISWGVRRRDQVTSDDSRAVDLSNYKVCRAGDLVINRMRAFQGALGITPEDGIASPDYAVLQVADSVNRAWLSYLMTSATFVSTMASLVRGIGGTEAGNVRTPRINVRDLGDLAVTIPTPPDQRAIADFLDRETAQIDTLIAKQEQLIATLRERRDALIRSALVSGLDRSVDTKPTGEAGLGSIPDHWGLVPTRHLCTITTGDEDSGNATEDGQYPFYVRGREILRSDRYTFDGEAVMTPGDGQGGTGKVFHYVHGRFVAHQRVYVFTDFQGVLGWYFFYFLSTFLRPIALAGSNTVTMESLRRPLLADFRIALPPLHEQQSIVAYLDVQTSKIDALIAKTGRFIELSKERRTALITAAVTGQIDVRNRA